MSARVTTFQKWPAQAQGQTYRIVPSASQANNLEYQTFADTVRAAIGPTGLVEAHAGQSARFDVSFVYDNPAAVAWVQSYGDPYFYNGFGPAWGGYYGGMRRGWSGSVMVMPSTVTVPVSIYKNTLEVTITDNQNHGAEVYRSTAVSASGSLSGSVSFESTGMVTGWAAVVVALSSCSSGNRLVYCLGPRVVDTVCALRTRYDSTTRGCAVDGRPSERAIHAGSSDGPTAANDP